MLEVQADNEAAEPTESRETMSQSDNDLEPLIAVAGALLNMDRLRVVAALSEAPANRVQLHEATGIGHRDLVRHIDNLQQVGLVRLAEPMPRQPDHYSLYELNLKAFSEARRAMGKHKGVKPRPTDAREMVLDTYMRGGKIQALPRKHEQLIIILDEVARRFEPEKQYTEREVNVILEELNEDYCTVRRDLVDFGYMSRSGGIYVKCNA